ncbi:molybdenum cofactor guanylyltransferase [Chloroflexota bacterium]
MDISCIVLTGGKGLRLGRNKVLEIIGNKSLLERVVNSISSFKSDIIIVTASGQSVPRFASYPRLKVVTDIYHGKGTLGGIYTGLITTETFYNLIVACDMPFLNQDLLRYMVQLAPGFDAVVPRIGHFVEPLHAIYSKNCLAAVEKLLREGNLRARDIFPLAKIRYVEAEEIDMFDPRHLSILNINTETDLEEARKLAKGEMRDVKR